MKVRNEARTQEPQALAAARPVPLPPPPPAPSGAAAMDTVAVDLSRAERSARIRERLGPAGLQDGESDAAVDAMRQRLLGPPSAAVFDLGSKDAAQAVLALLG